jgi:hypothetical protein
MFGCKERVGCKRFLQRGHVSLDRVKKKYFAVKLISIINSHDQSWSMSKLLGTPLLGLPTTSSFFFRTLSHDKSKEVPLEPK